MKGAQKQKIVTCLDLDSWRTPTYDVPCFGRPLASEYAFLNMWPLSQRRAAYALHVS